MDGYVKPDIPSNTWHMPNC